VASPGLAGTSDTYSYVSAAYSLQQTGQLLLADGQPYQWWPPLFVLVLRVVGAGSGVWWLNGVCLLGALVAWSIVGYWLLPARRVWALPLLLALGTPALLVSKFGWSESLVNLLWAMYFLALLRWLRRGGWSLCLIATAVGCLLPLQRIAGVFLLVGVGVGLGWPGTRHLARPSRWTQAAHLVSVSSGIVTWQLYQSVLGGTPNPPQPLGQTAAWLGFVLARWLVSLPASWLAAVRIVGWLVGLVGLLAWLWPRAMPQASGPNRWPAGWALLSARILFAGLVITLLLVIGSVASGRAGAGMHEAERFPTALYPPVALLVLLKWPNTRWPLGAVLLVAWVLYQGVRVGTMPSNYATCAPLSSHIRTQRPFGKRLPHPHGQRVGASS
jgi:hypothetical protein